MIGFYQGTSYKGVGRIKGISSYKQKGDLIQHGELRLKLQI